MKMRWQTTASSVSMRTISPTATPLPTAYDCVAVYIAGRRTNLVVYGCRPKPTTKKLTKEAKRDMEREIANEAKTNPPKIWKYVSKKTKI